MPTVFPIVFKEGQPKALIIDPSASHLAYAIVTFDFIKKDLHIDACGMLWTKDDWSRGKRYRYMYKAIQTLASGNVDGVPNAIFTEGFFVNPKMMFGSSVIPTINSLAEMAADDLKIPFFEMGPSTWRGILGIKPAITMVNGKRTRDYKVPTADFVSTLIKLPEKIPSNINRNMRLVPNDVTDVLAIAIALGRHHGLQKVSQSNTAFHPLLWIEKLEQLAKEI